MSLRRAVATTVVPDASPTRPRLRRHNFGDNHAYTLDCDCGQYRKGDIHKAIGVTTAAGYAKDADPLINWASRVTAEYAVNHWDRLADVPVADRLNEIAAARYKTVKAAQVRGTRIHALGERLAHGEAVDVPDELRGPVEAYAKFLDTWDIEMLATETPCANTTYGYAGTADGWGIIRRRSERALIDLKAGKGVYDTASLQLAAYRYTDIWQPDGPDSEEPTPEVDAVYVAHILPDDVRLLPVRADQAQWRNFLYAVQITRYVQSAKDASPIGDAIYPEETAR